MVLYHEFLPIPDGDIPAQWNRNGVVGHIHVCDSDFSGFECSRSNISAAAWYTVAGLGMGTRRLCDFRLDLESAGKPLGFSKSPVELPEREQLGGFARFSNDCQFPEKTTPPIKGI